jgi:hypothetical protein
VTIESAQRDLAGHHRDLARLQETKGREAARAAQAARKATAAAEAAGKSSSPSVRESKLRDAQRYQGEAIRHQRTAADLEAKVATTQRRVLDAQKRLVDAQKKVNNGQERMARRQLKAQKETAREYERRMRNISGTLATHSRLHVETKNMVDRLQQLPDRITVLFLALDPRDQNELLLGEEVRGIQEMIRKAKHRDSVAFESRWAVRPLDVLQAINECRPRIVHFSGHGSTQHEMLFQGEDGTTRRVSKEALVQTMAATSGDIELVFFNSCHSRGQAEAVVKHVHAAIGMNSAIGDTAARTFSAQFYSAIGFGLSVGRAFQQAKAALMLEGIPEKDTPQLLLAPEVDGEQLVLVRPENGRRPKAGPITSPQQSARAELALVQSEARRMKEQGERLNAGLHNGFWQQYIRLKFKPERIEAVYVQIFDAIRERTVLVTNLNDLIGTATAADQTTERFLAGDAGAVPELQQLVLNVMNLAHHVETGINVVLDQPQ